MLIKLNETKLVIAVHKNVNHHEETNYSRKLSKNLPAEISTVVRDLFDVIYNYSLNV